MKITIEGEDHFVVKSVTRQDVLAALGSYIEQRNLPYSLSLEALDDTVCSAYAADLADGFINYSAILKLMDLGPGDSRE